ncbi:MAG: zf-HC2 domain-containing protein [bacterium]
MKCKQVEQKLPLYVGRDLSKWQNFLLSWHVRSCSDCQEKLARFKAVRKFFIQKLQEETKRESAVDVWPALSTSLSFPSKTKPVQSGWKIIWRFRYRRRVIFVAGLFVLIFTLFVQLRQNVFNKTPSVSENPAPEELILATNYPVVESTPAAGTTVMTFQTKNPKIKIVWFFKDETKAK